MKKATVTITKASGDVVPFSVDKLKKSLLRSGASDDSANRVIEELIPKLYEGIPTKQIYRMAYDLLRGSSGILAARYSLKKAIMELGPSGFPFEKFVSGIFEAQGYSVKVGQLVKGQCVTHEIDVIAEKENELFLMECKYHNQPGIFCDVKVPLYINSRFDDVAPGLKSIARNASKTIQGWVVTNTKFSHDAIKYGTCAGLNLLGWDYPAKKGLKDQIDRLGLYPITCLTTFTKTEKHKLLEAGVVLCKEVHASQQVLKSIGMSTPRIQRLQGEIDALCADFSANKKGKRT